MPGLSLGVADFGRIEASRNGRSHAERGLQRRENQLDISTWRERCERFNDTIGVLFDEAPVGGHQYHYGKLPAGKILLITKTLVRADDRGKTLGLCSSKKLAVLH